MSDPGKAQKLASARKKFKELKKQKNSSSGRVEQQDEPPQNAPLGNYFHNANMSIPPISFFDNVMPDQPVDSGNNMLSDDVNSKFENNELYSGENSNAENVVSLEGDETKAINSFEPNQIPENDVRQFSSTSSVESIRQLSSMVAELVESHDQYIIKSPESELASRNVELSALLSEEKIKTQQLEADVAVYRTKTVQLESELDEKHAQVDSKTSLELSRLRDELQNHIQTVGILVGEKTELLANVSQFQLVARQKSEECEELQARLKASRSRVVELEREIGNLKTEISQHSNAGRENSDAFDKLKLDHQCLLDEKEELLQDLLEIREKLKAGTESNSGLDEKIAEYASQLSLANIKIQQLTSVDCDRNNSEIEKLTQEKFTLEKQIADLNENLKTVSKEREESNLQYQQYAQQLNGQLSSLAGRLDEMRQENDNLRLQDQNRIKHIGELEKQMQNLQNDQVSFINQKSNGDVRKELETTLESLQTLQVEKVELQANYSIVIAEKEALVNELEVKKRDIAQLGSLLEELKGGQTDNVKLLATMESDKVAAARAVAQNTEMKKQMDGMQEVFEKLNNDKVELTEKLLMEQKNNRDLIEKLQKTELHLQTLADAIEIKDRELSHLRENSMELNKQIVQTEQLSDRLRHYESIDNSSPSLQCELQEAKQTIGKLRDEVDLLKKAKVVNNIDEISEKVDNITINNEHLNEFKKTTTTTTNNNHGELNVLDRESAMKHLEAKFLKTMEDIATLTEEKQRLEHLVLQLQNETETIGEYVALYQHQRSILKQKALEKDQQLTQLANDRELIKFKLEQLRKLIEKLVMENGTVTSELLQHEILNNQQELCEEHARIHNEINKITENGLKTRVGNHHHENHSTEIAEQIIELLTEIKSSNLVQPAENYHHCPWCSGQLITV